MLFSEKKYLFPFDAVKKGSSVVLYGAGRVGKEFSDQIMDVGYCKCVAFVDKSAGDDKGERSYRGIKVLSPSALNTLAYDLIIISSYDYSDEIEKELIESGVPAEKIIGFRTPEFDSPLYANTMLRHSVAKMELYRDEIHRHIDATYRDIMIALERSRPYIKKQLVEVLTDYPVAVKSNDHLVPHGTIRDNTRYPRFVRRCEELFHDAESLNMLDMGCSGGGMVLEGALRGHLSIGLEGSDASLRSQRAEWRLLRDNLFTCDISRPFTIADRETRATVKFDVITMWEVLEHIPEERLPDLLDNIRRHLKTGGIFVSSVAHYDDIDEVSGVNWHATVKPSVWWRNLFVEHGFEIADGLFESGDHARGGYSNSCVYEEPRSVTWTDMYPNRHSHLTVKKARGDRK